MLNTMETASHLRDTELISLGWDPGIGIIIIIFLISKDILSAAKARSLQSTASFSPFLRRIAHSYP